MIGTGVAAKISGRPSFGLALLLFFAAAGFLLPSSGGSGSPAQEAAVWQSAPVKIALSSGLECLYQRDRTSPTTVIHIFTRGGKSAVPEGLDGLAYLAARLTLEIPDSDKARKLMTQATQMRYTVLEDYAAISIECLSDRLEEAVGILSGIIQSPLLSGLRIDHGKKTMALLGPAREDDAVETGHDAALKALFGGRGCGGALFGSEESLKGLGKKDISGFYDRYYNRDGLFFSVCSDLDPEKIRALLEASFDEIPPGEVPVGSPAAPALPPNRRVSFEKDTKQTYIARVHVLPAVSPALYARGTLLEALLGKGPGSRLWDLRTRDHLAYNVNARTTWTRGGGLIEAYLETDKTKVERAAPALAAVLRNLYDNGISEDELAMTKALARSWFLRGNEAKGPRAMTMGAFEALGLGADFLSGIFDALQGVTLEEMNAFIRSALDPALAVEVVVGPAGRDGPPADPGKARESAS